MKIQFCHPVSFGKIYINTYNKDNATTVKSELYEHTAYGIGDGSVAQFKEKYRLANLSEKYDIEINENGANVVNKQTPFSNTKFEINNFKDYPNVRYHILNAAINYVLLKDTKTFEYK